MTTDLEARLRRMYSAVAEQTLVDDPPAEEFDGTHPVLAALPTRRGQRPVVTVAAVALVTVVLAVVAVLVARRGDGEPASPMDGRPFAIPMWLPEDMGLDGTAVADVTDVRDFSPTVRALDARMTFHGADGRIVFIESYDMDDLTATPTGSTVQLADGTVAQWTDESPPRLAWTMPTGQAVVVGSGGVEVSQEELIQIASSLWYVDRATWETVTANAGYATADFQTWRIDGAETAVDATLSGSLRTGFRVGIGSVGINLHVPVAACTAFAPNIEDTVVFMAGASASAVLATGPDGEVVEVPLTMAPGLPMYRVGATSFPGATEQWLNGTDHSAGCTAVAP